jgi:hypothetical protein
VSYGIPGLFAVWIQKRRARATPSPVVELQTGFVREQGEIMTILFHLILLQNEAVAPEMTTGGWIFMIGAWAGILSLVIFCCSKILLKNRKR